MNKHIKTYQYLDLGEYEEINLIANKPNAIEVVFEYQDSIKVTTTDWSNIISRNNDKKLMTDCVYFHEDGYIEVKRYATESAIAGVTYKPTQWTITCTIHKDYISHFEDDDGNKINFDWKVIPQKKTFQKDFITSYASWKNRKEVA